MTPRRFALRMSAPAASFGLLALCAASAPPPQAVPPIPAPPAKLTLLFGGEQNGYLTPCGCSQPMLGGMPRRAAYLQTLSAQAPVISVENGDLTAAAGRQDELKAETLAEMHNTLGTAAICLGEKDFRLGLPFLQALQARFHGTFLCAGTHEPDGARLFPEVTVVSRPVNGRTVRVVVVGLLADDLAASVTTAEPDITFDSAADTLARLMPQVAALGDWHVLLFHGSKDAAEPLLRKFPGFDLVVYAHAGDHPTEAQNLGATTLVCSGSDGKYIGKAVFPLPSTNAKPTVQYVPLGPEFADETAIADQKKTYLERVAAENLLDQMPKSPTANGDTFAGSAACAACHAKEYRIWKQSGHAQAMAVLAKAQEDRDPECVPCHVVGADRIGGFAGAEKTPALQDVGCESCHGAAARHVKDPKVALPHLNSSVCIGCHNPQNSPRFDFAAYWPKIKH